MPGDIDRREVVREQRACASSAALGAHRLVRVRDRVRVRVRVKVRVGLGLGPNPSHLGQ